MSSLGLLEAKINPKRTSLPPLQVVGLGLGVWQISHQQNLLYCSTFLEALADLQLADISDLCLSWVLHPKDINGEVEWQFIYRHLIWVMAQTRRQKVFLHCLNLEFKR